MNFKNFNSKYGKYASRRHSTALSTLALDAGFSAQLEDSSSPSNKNSLFSSSPGSGGKGSAILEKQSSYGRITNAENRNSLSDNLDGETKFFIRSYDEDQKQMDREIQEEARKLEQLNSEYGDLPQKISIFEMEMTTLRKNIFREVIKQVTNKTGESFDGITMEEMVKLYALFDADGNGTIDEAELSAGFAKIGITLIPGELHRIMVIADTDSTGDIGFGEFVILMLERIIPDERYKEGIIRMMRK